MADGAMGYMFAYGVIALAACVGFVLCILWATTLIGLLWKWQRKRKYAIALGPLVLFSAFCFHCWQTDAPRRWVSEALPETEQEWSDPDIRPPMNY